MPAWKAVSTPVVPTTDTETDEDDGKIDPSGNNIIDGTKVETNDEEIEAKAKQFHETFNGKDGDGKEMPMAFFEEWARAYGKDGNYKQDFLYENTIYRRQGGKLAPTTSLTKAQRTWGRGNMK